MQFITNMPLIAQAFFGVLFVYAVLTLVLIIDRNSPAKFLPELKKIVSDTPVWR